MGEREAAVAHFDNELVLERGNRILVALALAIALAWAVSRIPPAPPE